MSLVAYDNSDISDSDEEQQTILNSKQETSSTRLDSKVEGKNEQSANLFVTLPTPKSTNSLKNTPEEEDDEFLHKKEKPLELPTKHPISAKIPTKKTTQIFLPTISSFDDDDDEQSTRVSKFQKSSKGTGLLNLLPQPKSLQNVVADTKKKSSASLVPDSVRNKTTPNSIVGKNKSIIDGAAKKQVKPSSSLSLIKYDSSDDSDGETSNKEIDFFSLNKAEAPPVEIMPPIENAIVPEEINYFTEHSSATVSCSIDDEVHLGTEPQYQPEPISNFPIDMDSEALQKLAGSRAMRKGEAVQFIDIDQKAILPDPREWLTKALTEDTSKRMSSSKRRGDEPTNQQRRKHQITYLAHQAKANEQELQNQWANNRLSKKQTQSKYGF